MKPSKKAKAAAPRKYRSLVMEGLLGGGYVVFEGGRGPFLHAGSRKKCLRFIAKNITKTPGDSKSAVSELVEAMRGKRPARTTADDAT